MKTVRGTFDNILSTHRDLWVDSREDVLAYWSESDLQETKVCTCGKAHLDDGFEMNNYIAMAFELIHQSGNTVMKVHVPPHRKEQLERWARYMNIAVPCPPPQDDVYSSAGHPTTHIWGAQIVVNADLGAEVLRVRSVNAVGVPLREVEFAVPWED